MNVKTNHVKTTTEQIEVLLSYSKTVVFPLWATTIFELNNSQIDTLS